MRKLLVLGFLMVFSNLLQAQIVAGGRLCAPDPGCKTDSTTFADSLKTATAWKWSFGDGGGSTKQNPKHLYTQSGPFTVTLTHTVAGVETTFTKAINIGTLPPIFQPWKKDTTICPGQKLVINPYSSPPMGAKYLWYPTGDTTQTITTDSSGCYSVQVTLANGCSYEDRVKVKICLEQSNQEGAKWFFGSNAGLDFNGGSPRPIADGQLNTPEGTSVISNYKGKLLFYTDGVSVFGADHKPMFSKDPAPLAGNQNSTQSALIVPQPTCRGCEYLYYIFTTSEINGKKQLSYSVVDMRQNGGKGAVTQKNIPVQNVPTSEQIVSVRNDKDSTYWIISHDYGNNAFRVYHATTAGIQDAGVYPLGAAQNTPNQAEGYMKFSPKNDTTGLRKLAIVIPGPPKNLVQVYDFNDSSGRIIGPPLTLDLGPAPPKAYGVEFSPDGKKMYVSMQGNGTDKAPSKIWQYELDLKDSTRITDSKILIDSSATKIYGALQIGSDGKIYLAVKDSGYLGVINAPNSNSQIGVKFVEDGLFLAGKKSQLGLPNFVQNFTNEASGPGFTYADTCSGKPTNFQASPLCDPLKDTYTWNFGDGSAVTSSKQQAKAHTYAKAGTYKVSLRLVNQCKDTTISQNVTIIATPDDIKLRSPIDTCVNVLQLDAGVKADKYLWVRNGFVIGRTQKITITNAQSGNYTVIAANGEEGQCPTLAQSRITVRKPPAFSLGIDTSFCVGNNTGIQLDARKTPTRWDTFKWSTGESSQTININRAGIYSVEVKNNATQCINNDTISVKILPKARLQAILRPPTACLAKDGGITISGVIPAGNYVYNWFSGTTSLNNNTNILNNVGQGLYKVQLNGTASVCPTDSTFSLQANNNLRLSSAVVNAKCTQPTSGNITVTATGGIPATYAWTNATKMPVGISKSLLDNLSPGKYNVKVTDNNGCEANLDDIVVGITLEKFINLGLDRRKCIGDTVILSPSSLLAGNVYSWSTSETTPQISVKQAGTYKVTVTNTLSGCKDDGSLNVSFAPRPPYDLTKEASICEQDNGTALLLVKGAANLKYFWIRGERTEPRLVVNKAGSYPIKISNPEGCELIDTSFVIARCEPEIYIPDVFTPNGDGINDVLELKGNYFIDLEFRIFNRWGEMIYYSTDLSQKWDGIYRGQAYPPMTYPWLVSFRPRYAPLAPLTVKRGAILLMR